MVDDALLRIALARGPGGLSLRQIAARGICQNALEGLATQQLNMAVLTERRARAQERRVAPETISSTDREAADSHRLEWVPSGHPLFEPLDPFLHEVRDERVAVVDRVMAHVEWSLSELLFKADEEIGRAQTTIDDGIVGAEGRLAQAEARFTELQVRRDRYRAELAQERALTLQDVDRITSVLVLPHPDRATPEIARLHPNLETEQAAMDTVIAHETALGRQVFDLREKNLGYDVTSLDLASGDLRPIEVKGLAGATGIIRLTPNEKRVAEGRRDCYWLYVVTNCAATPVLCEQRKDLATIDWHEVTTVAHYHVTVGALKRPMGFSDRPQAPFAGAS